MAEDGELEDPREEERFEVWPENWPVVALFLDCIGQWRVAGGFAGMRYIGLDYSAVEAVMRLREVARADRGELFAGLRVMEAAALKALNRRDG